MEDIDIVKKNDISGGLKDNFDDTDGIFIEIFVS